MAKVKGLTFADARAFVESRGGREAWDRLREIVGAEDRGLLDEVVAVGWYDLGAHTRMLEAMPKALRDEAQYVMKDYARFSAERHVSKVYRVLFLVANPALILEKSGEYWSRFYDTGTWKVTRESDTRVRGELVGFAAPTTHSCDFLTTYVGSLFERIGCKDVRSTHPHCRVRGDAVCTYFVDWR